MYRTVARSRIVETRMTAKACLLCGREPASYDSNQPVPGFQVAEWLTHPGRPQASAQRT